VERFVLNALKIAALPSDTYPAPSATPLGSPLGEADPPCKEVLGAGLEPACLSAYAPQTYVSAIPPPEHLQRVMRAKFLAECIFAQASFPSPYSCSQSKKSKRKTESKKPIREIRVIRG
jgi:hypothetical protein